jgi:hypothetical protein
MVFAPLKDVQDQALALELQKKLQRVALSEILQGTDVAHWLQVRGEDRSHIYEVKLRFISPEDYLQVCRCPIAACFPTLNVYIPCLCVGRPFILSYVSFQAESDSFIIMAQIIFSLIMCVFLF